MSVKPRHQLPQDSIEKLMELRAAAINPYPYGFAATHDIADLNRAFDQFVVSRNSVAVASRVMSTRSAGKKLVFLDLAATAQQIRKGLKIQVMIRHAKVDKASWVVVENLGVGDWIGVQGICQYTKTGEPTILASQVTMLSKSLRPIPLPKVYETTNGEIRDAYGARDLDLMWRYPELDMLIRRKAYTLTARSTILNAVRQTLLVEYKCIEVETPYLNIFFGGAEATPFTTYIRALDQEVFLAISPEIELKRAIVGGMGTGGDLGRGVFTIARNFRNEGVDRTHNPEFTSMEVYIPFVDFEYKMELTERIFAEACKAVHNSSQCSFNGRILEFGNAWPRLSMTDLVSDKSGIDVQNQSIDQIRTEIEGRGLHIGLNLDEERHKIPNENFRQDLLLALEQTHIASFYSDCENLSAAELRLIALNHKLHKPVNLDQEWDFLVMDLFEIYCEPNLIEPVHIILHPAKSTVLCKEYRKGQLPNGNKLIERFESFAFGMELSNAYSELNDPLIQRRLVEEQADARAHGEEKAMPHNEAFLRAIEMGMPPCGGLGIGIDRLVMLLTNSSTIRDVIAFPMVGRETP